MNSPDNGHGMISRMRIQEAGVIASYDHVHDWLQAHGRVRMRIMCGCIQHTSLWSATLQSGTVCIDRYAREFSQPIVSIRRPSWLHLIYMLLAVEGVV